jgi:hypothetical protein
MFVEIKDGIFVKACSIEAIIDTTDKGVMVYTSSNSFPSELPSNVILDMISKDKQSEIKPNENSDKIEQILNILKTQNTPMGG